MIIKGPDDRYVKFEVDAVCHDCKHRHKIEVIGADQFNAAMWEWHEKHPQHRVDFVTPRRRIPARFRDKIYQKLGFGPWWLHYKENANLKIAWASSAAMTITLASLATSSTFVAGREGTAISETTNKYIDERLGAKITTGTTPTDVKEIRIYGYASLEDTPTYPDVLDGTDSNETLTNTSIRDQLPLLGAVQTNSTSNVTYWFSKLLTVSEAFGVMPKQWGVFVAHNTGVNLNATGSNHAIWHTGAYFTSI